MNRRDFLTKMSIFASALILPNIKIYANDEKEIVGGNLFLINEDKIVDNNAGNVEVIPIRSQEDLEKIGFHPDYPINGIYMQKNNIRINKEFKMIGRAEPFCGSFYGNNRYIAYPEGYDRYLFLKVEGGFISGVNFFCESFFSKKENQNEC